jgi:hypothetical protein
MTLTDTDTNGQSAPHQGPAKPLTETLIAALVLTAASDRLLFNAPLGLSLFVIAALTGGLALFLHRTFATFATRISAGFLYGLGVLPVLENVSLLSMLVMLALFAVASLMLADGLRGTLFEKLRRLTWFAMAIPVSAPIGVSRWRKAKVATGETIFSFAKAGEWLMPLVIGLAFLGLFQEANPVIADWLRRINFWAIFDVLNPERLVFAGFMFVMTWAFLKPHVHKLRAARQAQDGKVEALAGSPDAGAATLGDILFGEAAILRSLIVFNVLFAVQTLLDLTYLTGGAALPSGMTYASYAHRGAYPLIVTALMAALFVLLALRSKSAARANPLIRNLVYLWIGQNIALTGTSIYRLDLYVSEYGLTYWRIGAFIWMMLVAFGLATIVWRIAADKSAGWLVGANLAALSLALYSACFINFAALIANYNIDHGQQDYRYLTDLGAEAIPAIDRAIRSGLADGATVWIPDRSGDLWEPDGEQGSLPVWRAVKAGRFGLDYADWRGFTLRKWRLSRYLAYTPMPETVLHGRVPESRR